METPNYYAVIPATVRYDARLKPSEKLLYGEISALSQKDGYCFATNRYFSELYSVAKETISRWISHLQELGYIGVDMVKTNSGAIDMRRIVIFPSKDQYPLTKKDIPPCRKDQGTIYNNTSKNNIHAPHDQIKGFERFWSVYPKRKGKEAARKAFAKLEPDDELLGVMIAAIQQEMKSDQWKRNGGQYIPYPATWLNQRRWEDEPDKPFQEDEDDDIPDYLTHYL
jgi:hypothetical protein